MARKNKAVAFVVAVLVSLSLTTGVMAQASDSEEVSATLNGGVCSVAITSASGNFGSWTWDGEANEYDLTSTPATVTVNVKVTGDFDGVCGIQGGFGGLTRDGGSEQIPVSRFTLPAGYSNVNQTPEGTYNNQPVTLNSVPNDVPPGIYKGTLSVAVVNSQ